MIPPTPTPLPAGTPHFTLPDDYSLWGSTDTAIHFWNWLGDGGTVLQALILIALTIAGMALVWRFARQILHQLLYHWHTGRTADEDHFVQLTCT